MSLHPSFPTSSCAPLIPEQRWFPADHTRNCDDAGAYLEKICPELQGAVLAIHTKDNGGISEAASGKKKEELDLLRKLKNFAVLAASFTEYNI